MGKGNGDDDKPEKKPPGKKPVPKKSRRKNPLLKKRNVKPEFKDALDLDNDGVRGTVTEKLSKEEWVKQLKKEGFTDIYSKPSRDGVIPKGKSPTLPAGTKALDADDFGKELNKIFPKGGPDLVAVDHKRKRILAADVTAKSSSTSKIVVDKVEKEVHHLDKTKSYAEKIASHFSTAADKKFAGYEVHFQDRYTEQTGRKNKSARFKVPKYKAASQPPLDRNVDGGSPDAKQQGTKDKGKADNLADLKKKRLEDIRRAAEKKKAAAAAGKSGADGKPKQGTPHRKPEKKVDKKLNPKPVSKVKAKVVVKPKLDPKKDLKADAQIKARAKDDATPKVDSKPRTDLKPKTDVKPKADVKPKLKDKPDIKVKPAADGSSKAFQDIKTKNLADSRGINYKPSISERGLPGKVATHVQPNVVKPDVDVIKPKNVTAKGRFNVKLKISPKIKAIGGFVITIAFDLLIGYFEAKALQEDIEDEISKNAGKFTSLLEETRIQEDIVKFRTGDDLEKGYQLYFVIRLFFTRRCSDGGCGWSGRITSIHFMDVTYSRTKGDDFIPDATEDKGWGDTWNNLYGAIGTIYNPIFESGFNVHFATENAADDKLEFFDNAFIKREGTSMGDYHREYFNEFRRYSLLFPDSLAARHYAFLGLDERLRDLVLVELREKKPFILMWPPHNLQFHEVIETVRWGLVMKVEFIYDFYEWVIQLSSDAKIYYLEKYDHYFRMLDDAYTKCQVSCHKMIDDRRIIHRITADDVRKESQFMDAALYKKHFLE